MFESKESKFIREDQKSHPNCQYSQSYQSMCSNRTGKYQCEKVSKIVRLCPGESPMEVYRDSDNENHSSGHHHVEGFGIDSHLGKLFDGFFNFGGADSSRGSPNVDSFLNDFFQMPPPLDQFKDRAHQTPRDSDRPYLLPPHKVPRGQPPIQSDFKLDDYVNGPPESL
jgi:hypothetical protein